MNNERGSELSFRSIVENHQERVINICFRFLNNRDDAEDAAQEVFIDIYRSIERFRGESRLSTWIYRIAVTKSLDIIRAKNRKKRLGNLQKTLGLDNRIEQAPDREKPDPLRVMEDHERYAALYTAINSLRENQRVAITLCKLEGFSVRETAEILGTSESSVESLIFRGKKKLEKQLKRHYKKVYN